MSQSKEVKEILAEIDGRIKHGKHHYRVCIKHEIWSAVDRWEFKITTLKSLRDWITTNKAKKK